MDNVDLNCNVSPVCPHCGYELRDAWELFMYEPAETSGTVSCGHCDREYWVEREVMVTYSTRKLKKVETA
jgi:uncharacterized protein with PIN domain